MIWLTWRQHRKRALFTGIALALLVAFMIPTGLATHHAFVNEGLAACVRARGHAELIQEPKICETAGFDQFNTQYGGFRTVGVLFVFLPLLVGLFWGAPLVAREVEQGTHRLVWTQAVSRRRWALVQFGLVGGVALIVSVVYGLGMSWWMSPLSQSTQDGRLGGMAFDLAGLVPIGYTLFAVALGIFAGTVWPKVLSAMAVAVTGFLALRVALITLARPHYLPARTLTYPVEQISNVQLNSTEVWHLELNSTVGDLIVSSGVRNAAGKMVAAGADLVCSPPPGGHCAGKFGVGAYNWKLYQPASRFWTFQGIETGIYVALAALLLYLALRRIRRIT